MRLVCPFPPGGAVDAAARIIAGRLCEMWGQQMVIENRAARAATSRRRRCCQADADGYTVYIASIGHAITSSPRPRSRYHPVNDFAPVTLMCVYPNIMAMPNSSPDRSVPDFIARAKANPGKMTYASSGIGTSLHLAGELFKRMAGVDRHAHSLSRRGACAERSHSRPRRCDLRELSLDACPMCSRDSCAGSRSRPRKRQPEVPDLPAIAEFLPGYDVSSWFALFVATKTPPEIVAKLHRDAIAALNTPPVKARYAQLGATVVASTPAELAAHLQAEMDRWGPVIKAAGIKDG